MQENLMETDGPIQKLLKINLAEFLNIPNTR